ncbi:MAG: hypothetical protein QM817_13820 [Archangium sp.]
MVEADALAVDLSSPQIRRNAPVLMVSRLVSARVLGTVASGHEHFQVARFVLDHFERVTDHGEAIFGVRLDVLGLGAVYLMMVEDPQAFVFGVIAESELTHWQAGRLVVLTSVALSARELYGEPAPEIAELNLGGGFRLFALGASHVVMTTPLARALGETPSKLARELIAMPVASGLRACRIGAIDLALGRLSIQASGRAVEVILACLPNEQRSASRVVRRVKKAIALWGSSLQ